MQRTVLSGFISSLFIGPAISVYGANLASYDDILEGFSVMSLCQEDGIYHITAAQHNRAKTLLQLGGFFNWYLAPSTGSLCLQCLNATILQL